MKLQDRTALVTGAGVRVGRAIAEGLAREGMRLLVHYHSSAAEAEAVVRGIRERGGEAVALGADLSRPAEVRRLAEEAEAAFGGVDVLVNSASVFPAQGLLETTAEIWERAHAVNLRAPFFLSQALGARMRERGEGAIVNIADLAGMQAWSGYAAHGVSKAGLVHLTRVAARELAPEVRVNAVAPGTVLPPEEMPDEEVRRLERRIPLGRIGSPADVVEAVLYLLRADFVTGEVLRVDGGRAV